MSHINPFLLTDGYKTSHHIMYPEGTTLVYSNFTPRSNKYALPGTDKVLSFGQQMVMQQIHESFEQNFFHKPKDEVLAEISQELGLYLNTEYNVAHIGRLHDLGYLPIAVKAIEEGSLVLFKLPVLTIYNTHPDFYWITNYLETLISNLLWKPLTSATIAYQYLKLQTAWLLKTDAENSGFVNWQGHDFSMRGMDSVEASISSGLGHATCFLGSDTLPVIYGARKYYHETGFVVGSVPASEHSVMCAGSKESEQETFERLLKLYPAGILSVVSDTWDLWQVVTVYLPALKEKILAREGKLVIRPDSGDPADIVCGLNTLANFDPSNNTAAEAPTKGVVELLWDVFGGTVNAQGFKILNPHLGVIYGDSITLQLADSICQRLASKGFASSNIVFGIGSFTYTYNTRDTLGLACKATYVEIAGEGREIFKNPVTDDGTKKSAKGLIMIEKDGDTFKLKDECTWAEEATGALQEIYRDGKFYNQTTLSAIRERVKSNP